MRIIPITALPRGHIAVETDAHLHQTVLHDCHGHVTHTFTLLLDGTVRIDLPGGRHAVVDPTSRQNLTPHVPVTPALMDHAAQVGPW